MLYSAWGRQPCASEYDQDWPLPWTKCSHTHLKYRDSFDPVVPPHTQLQLNSVLAALWGPEYRWFILSFIKERGAPLKRDQSATRLEESASNWPFIKKLSQVDFGGEISCMTSERCYIYYTTDEPHALWLNPLWSQRGRMHTHTTFATPEYLWKEVKHCQNKANLQ